MQNENFNIDKNLTIIILNYESYWETIQCVDSIIDNAIHTHILIVDNASTNDSVNKLHEKYDTNDCIEIITSKHNLGFAKGNNLGISYARKKFHTDYILLLNSDTKILQPDYIERLVSAQEEDTAVIQSNALRTNGRYTAQNRQDISISVIINDFLYTMCDFFDIYYPKKKKGKKKTDIYISGCDFLFTPLFFQYFEGLYPFTFLFLEENILMLMLHKAHLKCTIADNAVILHKESKSTPDDYKIGRKKRIRTLANGNFQLLIVKLLPLFAIRRLIKEGVKKFETKR